MSTMPTFPQVCLSRRQMMRSSVALGAFMLPGGIENAVAAPRRRQAKGVILILLEGGMSHLDSWDPKPNAPAEVAEMPTAIQEAKRGVQGLRRNASQATANTNTAKAMPPAICSFHEG